MVPGTLEDDQNRRDFTINALAISLNARNPGEVLDPFGGIDDIRNGIIRTPLDPDATFSDDPLRMMRAVRFAAQLGFTVSEETMASIARNAERIKIVSAERITTELNKIMETAIPSVGFLLLDETGLLDLILPEVAGLKGLRTRMAKGTRITSTIPSRFLTTRRRRAMTSGCAGQRSFMTWPSRRPRNSSRAQAGPSMDTNFMGARMVPEIFTRLKLPLNDRMKYVKKLVGLHLRPISLVQEEVTDSAVRRLLFEAGDDIDDLMLLCEADITSGNRMKVQKHRDNFALVRRKLKEIEEKDAVRTFQPPVHGEEIIAAFDIPPGPIVGVIKSAIKEAILDGVIPNEHEAAREYMIKKGIGTRAEAEVTLTCA